jgi:hypothetical protein
MYGVFLIIHSCFLPLSSSKLIDHSWQYHWHRFIDHLAEGKTPEDFFRELLD